MFSGSGGHQNVPLVLQNVIQEVRRWRAVAGGGLGRVLVRGGCLRHFRVFHSANSNIGVIRIATVVPFLRI